jgi:ABC-type lipoprotein release transport system permease subunit
MEKIKRVHMTVAFLAVFGVLLQAFLSAHASNITRDDKNILFQAIIESLDHEKIKDHVETLSSFDSRVTGYPGCSSAADYIHEVLENYGLTVFRQSYSVVVPIDHGSNIYIFDDKGRVERSIEAYAVWPNLVQTSRTPTIIKGQLIYVGDGGLSDFNGKVVKDKIVLMDFNSGDNWINAAKLGAKAVIFIAPSETSYTEAREKFLKTPIYFPRLYVSSREGTALWELALSKSPTIGISLNMQYETVAAENIIGVVNGTTSTEDIIVVAAHYDTWSVIPRLAPGADEATAVASLLELAKYFAQNPPKKTLWFVALSGHYQALAGAREFTEKFFFGGKKIWAFIGLDFSTDGYQVALLYRGHMYDFGGTGVVLRWTRWLGPRIFNDYIPSLEKQRGKSYDVRNGFVGFTYGWWCSIPVPYMLDSEPFAIAHGLGFTIRTDGVRRSHWGHPLSREVSFENLWPQVEVASAIVFGLANEDQISPSPEPARYLFTAAGGDLAGFLTVRGKVLYYNVSRGWYEPFPNAICVATRIDKGFSSYPFSTIITISDENGEFIVIGGSGYGYGHGYGIVDQWNFEAYHLSGETGLIDYAPDYGQYGMRSIQFTYSLNTQPYNVSTVLFRSSSAVIFDVIDPIAFNPKVFFDPRFENSQHSWTISGRWSLNLYDFSTLSEYIMWGYYSVGFEDVAMVFVPPNTSFMILYRVSQQIVGILLNASDAHPQGYGFFIGSHQELHIPMTAYRFVNDLFYLTSDRYLNLKSSSLRNPVVERDMEELAKHRREAEDALAALKYDQAYSELLLAWGWAARGYSETMSVIFDAVNINVIFFALLLAFVFFFERLVFESSGAKRGLVTAGIFAILLYAYWYIHPAPKLAVNAIMSPLSVAILVLFIFVSILLADRMGKIIRGAKLKLIGKHFVEQATMSLTTMSFSYSPRVMRKRRIRTSLVMSTVLITTFALIAFTSIFPTSEAKFAFLPDLPATYEGLLFKKEMYVSLAPDNIISPAFLDSIKAVAPDAIIAPRVWHYPQLVGTEAVYQSIVSDKGSARVKAVLGLSPNEIELYTTSIKGRWFYDFDRFACILPERIAERLQVDVGDTVRYSTFNLTVIGIYNSELFNSLRDLDNYAITPVDPNLIPSLAAGRPVEGQAQAIPLSWEEIIVVPWKTAYHDLGGYIASVTVRTDNRSTIKAVSNSLALILKGVRIYTSLEEKVYVPSPVSWFEAQGWAFTVVPIILGCLTMFNTIITGVKERVGEIKIYSSIGLSPKGVTLIFFAESIIYAVTAGVLGYLLGIAANLILVETGYLPVGFVSNTSSLATVVVLIASISSIILATIYPAIIASRLITPSLERKWKITTKPKGDEWTIPLPVSVESDTEVYGIINYLSEYFSAHTVESEQPFIVMDIKPSREEKALITTMRLLPLESNVIQELMVRSYRPENETKWFFSVDIKKLAGVPTVWASTNRIVVDAIRKQLLLWRSLREEDRIRYLQNVEQRG